MSAPPSTTPGRLIVLSAPSGSGKTTLAHGLVASVPRLRRSVSFTTRPRREQEVDGQDYHFVSGDTFRGMVAEHAFLEWAEIYGCLYGTGRKATDEALAGGDDVLLVIDVQGARLVRQSRPEALFVFLLPPSHDALVKRLRSRGTESTGTEAERMAVAREEIRAWTEYDYLIINDDLPTAVEAAVAVVRGARQTRDRMAGVAAGVAASFPPPERPV